MVIDTNLAEQVRDHLLRVQLEEVVRQMEHDIAFYESRRLHTIEDATSPEDAMAGSAVWDTLIGERRYAVGLIDGLLKAQGPDPMAFVHAESFRVHEPIGPMRPAYAEPDWDAPWGAGEDVEASRG